MYLRTTIPCLFVLVVVKVWLSFVLKNSIEPATKIEINEPYHQADSDGDQLVMVLKHVGISRGH